MFLSRKKDFSTRNLKLSLCLSRKSLIHRAKRRSGLGPAWALVWSGLVSGSGSDGGLFVTLVLELWVKQKKTDSRLVRFEQLLLGLDELTSAQTDLKWSKVV
ncbi:hypothetical protein WMY93_033210 [Mugilogobius chulae]|uniref:Uncharacterized protein n=1 Tax=Mugilogobius chulae TaxID=88201 RepID=A0AAW0MLV9_9GOBI